MCAALQVVLQMLGHRARFAGDVASALRAADEETFDVLLSDIGLPDGNGWDLLRQLELTDRRPPCAVAMSSFGLHKHAERSKEAGFVMYLVKPFSPEELIAALDQAVLVPVRRPRSPAMQQTGEAKPMVCLQTAPAELVA